MKIKIFTICILFVCFFVVGLLFLAINIGKPGRYILDNSTGTESLTFNYQGKQYIIERSYAPATISAYSYRFYLLTNGQKIDFYDLKASESFPLLYFSCIEPRLIGSRLLIIQPSYSCEYFPILDEGTIEWIDLPV